MCTKFNDFVMKHFDVLTSVRTLYIVFATMSIAILVYAYADLLNRHDAAKKYIEELEEVITFDDTIIGDICGGDGYAEWYGGM